VAVPGHVLDASDGVIGGARVTLDGPLPIAHGHDRPRRRGAVGGV